MIDYFKVLLSCTLAGMLLATIFVTSGGALAGAVKGLLLGALIVWGEWKSHRDVVIVSYVRD